MPQTAALKIVSLGLLEYPWFHGTTIGADGKEMLMLTTVHGQNYNKVTPATPAHLLSIDATGVADVTSTYFDIAPTFFWARNVVTFTDPETNQPAIWFCSQGRESGNYTDAPTPRVNGNWGEQDQLFVMQNNKYINRSAKLPQSVDFSHGCAVANFGSGTPLNLVKNTLGSFEGNPSRQLLINNGSAWVTNTQFSENILGAEPIWWTGAADFAKAGKDDVVFSRYVVRRTGSTFAVQQTLSAPDLETQGYTNFHSGTIGDLNGDGYPDLVMVLSGDGGKVPHLAGAMLAVFLNDGTGNLIYKPSALPSIAPDEFGLDVKIIDVNFDGKADIVTSGNKYTFGSSSTDTRTSALLINDGNTVFIKKALNDPALNSQCSDQCQQGYYFLKGKDASSFQIAAYSQSFQSPVKFYGRVVTPATPLIFEY